MNILSNWKLSIFILIFFSVIYVLLIKKLLYSLQPQSIMFYIMLVALVGFAFLNIKDNSFKINLNESFLLLVTGIIILIINYMTLSTIKILPNAGYIRIVNTISMIITVIICTFIFKDKFTIQKFIGLALCAAGGILFFIK